MKQGHISGMLKWVLSYLPVDWFSAQGMDSFASCDICFLMKRVHTTHLLEVLVFLETPKQSADIIMRHNVMRNEYGEKLMLLHAKAFLLSSQILRREDMISLPFIFQAVRQASCGMCPTRHSVVSYGSWPRVSLWLTFMRWWAEHLNITKLTLSTCMCSVLNFITSAEPSVSENWYFILFLLNLVFHHELKSAFSDSWSK